jgi:phage baseplate assembly protein W
MPIVTNTLLKKTVFTDIDLNFDKNPISGDISIKKDDYAIKQALHTLVLTKFYEKPFHPEFGSHVNDILFEPVNFITKERVKDSIINTIENWEYRIKIISVDVNIQEDENSFSVSITYKLNNTSTQTQIDFILYRSR